MGLSLAEQETVITFDKEEKTMNVYTADPALMRRLRELPAYELVREHRQDGKVIAADFKADKKLLTLRGKKPVSNMTEEQRKAASARMRAYHKSK